MGIFSMGKPAKSEAPEFIEVGQIVNTHGVKGDVKVQPWDVTPAQQGPLYGRHAVPPH